MRQQLVDAEEEVHRLASEVRALKTESEQNGIVEQQRQQQLAEAQAQAQQLTATVTDLTQQVQQLEEVVAEAHTDRKVNV